MLGIEHVQYRVVFDPQPQRHPMPMQDADFSLSDSDESDLHEAARTSHRLGLRLAALWNLSGPRLALCASYGQPGFRITKR